MRGSIVKKGNRYYIVVDAGLDADGKRQQKWYSGYAGRREAELALPEILRKVSNTDFTVDSKTTLREYLTKWTQYIKNNVRESTFGIYTWAIEKYIVPQLGQQRLAKLKPLTIQSFYTSLASSELSPTSIHYLHRVLNQALKQAVKWQLIYSNPCDALEAPKKQKYQAQVLTAEQISLLLDNIRDKNIYLPVLLATTAGLRRGEICGLRWDDVDLERGVLAVRNSLDWEHGKLTIRPVKTSTSMRPVKLSEDALEAVRKKRHAQELHRLAIGPGLYHDQGFVWAWEDGRPHDPDYLYKQFRKALQNLNLPAVRFHDLRHSHATLLLQEGISIKVVSERLGHSSTHFTQDIYSHVLPNMQDTAAAAMDNLFRKPKK